MPENYPEPTDGTGPLQMMNVESIDFGTTALSAQYQLYDYNGMQFAYWTINGGKKSPTYTVNETKTVPYIAFQMIMPTTTTSLPIGTFQASKELAFNTLYAGDRNDIGECWGSMFHLIYSALYRNGNGTVKPMVTWLLVDGSLTINDDENHSWSFTGHTLAGKEVTIHGTAITDNGLVQQQ